MSLIDDMSREKWILDAFPEWGTWLNEEIDQKVVSTGNVAMWWLGCTGVWIKTENNTNIAIDLWFGNGKRSQKNKNMEEYHQMRNMTGGRLTQAEFVLKRRWISNIQCPQETKRLLSKRS